MCVICSQWNLGKLTSVEALNNLWELNRDTDFESEEYRHFMELAEDLMDDLQSKDPDYAG